MKPKHDFEFGDLIENYYASEDSPRRKGIFVRKNSKGHIELTDGKGAFWLGARENELLVKVGSVLVGSDPIPLPTIKPGDTRQLLHNTINVMTDEQVQMVAKSLSLEVSHD